MIDTICLLIPKEKLLFLSENNGPAWSLQSHTEEYDKFVRNPTKLQKESGKYYPRLTGYKRKYRDERNVKIEFSIPKIIYNNNLDEVEENQFDEVVNTLKNRLREMGIVATEKAIKKAQVSSIHYSKNIVLEDGYTVNQVISELNKIDLRKIFDFAKARFINDGQSLYLHTTSHEFTIYDKLADMKKDKKRAIDKDQTMIQRTLFNQIEKKKILSEVLRFEVRLGKKVKMDSLLEKLGYSKHMNFEQVFKKEISQKVVTHYWETLITERNLGLFTIQTGDKDILRSVYRAIPKIKPNRAIYLTGLLLLAKDGNGMRELRSILEKKSNSRTWFRIAKDVRELSSTLPSNLVRCWVKQVDTALLAYKALKIKDYEEIV
jgi:hypothetical protein